MSFQCSKCQKFLSSKQYLQKHEEKCNGLKTLQCELCHKKFTNRNSKYAHKKNKVCERNGTMIISENSFGLQGDYNTLTNCNNHTHHHHYHIHIGKENLEYLPEELKKAFSHKYMDPKVLKEFHKLVHFNPEHPENHVIAKTDANRNEYHVKFESGVFKIKFKEMYSLLKELYEKIDGKLIEPWGDWKYDKDGEPLLHEENISQRNERIGQLKNNVKTILYGLSKEHPEITDKIRKKSKKVPPSHPQPDINM